jgi:hypothetical protein
MGIVKQFILMAPAARNRKGTGHRLGRLSLGSGVRIHIATKGRFH